MSHAYPFGFTISRTIRGNLKFTNDCRAFRVDIMPISRLVKENRSFIVRFYEFGIPLIFKPIVAQSLFFSLALAFFRILQRRNAVYMWLRAGLRYEMNLQKYWATRLTNESWRGYISRLGLGHISRSYRRLEISSPGRCSLKPRALVHPIRLPRFSRSLGSLKRRHKVLSASILYRSVKLSRPFLLPCKFFLARTRVAGSQIVLPGFGLCSWISEYHVRGCLARIVGKRS